MAHMLAALVLALALSSTTHAQINSPPPTLMGQASHHLYSVPGVVHAGSLATFFSCTNTTDNAIRVGVEVFGPGGGAPQNDASATSLNVSPSGTAMFGSTAAGLSPDSNIAIGLISKGSARILAGTMNRFTDPNPRP